MADETKAPGAAGQAAAKPANKSRAAEIMEAHKVGEVYENSKGEFFLNQNLALLSEKVDKKKVIIHSAKITE